VPSKPVVTVPPVVAVGLMTPTATPAHGARGSVDIGVLLVRLLTRSLPLMPTVCPARSC
jgi:hypothetical protein